MEKTLPKPFKLNISPLESGFLFFLILVGAVLGTAPFLGANADASNEVSFSLPWIVSLVYFACAVWIFSAHRTYPAAIPFTIFSASVALVFSTWFFRKTSGMTGILWSVGILLAAAALVDLAITFRQPTTVRLKVIRGWIYGLSGVFFAVSLLRFILPASPRLTAITSAVQWGVAFFAIFYFLVWLGLRKVPVSVRTGSLDVRPIVAAGMAAFLPSMVWVFASPLLQSKSTYPAWLLLLLPIFPIISGLFIQRQRRVSSDILLSRSAAFGLLSVLIVFGYALLVTGIGLVFNSMLGSQRLILQGVAIFILAVLFDPLRNALQNRLDQFFFRSRKVLDEELIAFSNRLVHQVDTPTLIQSIRSTIETTLSPTSFHIYLYDALSEQYLATPAQDKRPTSDLRYAANNPLVAILNESHLPRTPGSLGSLPPAEKSRLQILRAEVLIPLPGRDRLAGWLVLGSRRSSEPYSGRELAFLESIADQASQAFERTQIIGAMENRVHEMNVLGRVAQGVNITLQMDDIFELIYAQTTQIVPAEDFYLMLLHPETGELIDTFHVENDDRLGEKEQKTVAKDRTLEEDVARNGRSLLVEDYNAEAHQRGLADERPGVTAWMGVPLNAGAGSIGVISMARREVGSVFSREQLNLLQRIADQAAGSIVKARLLSESERRARQLTTLNEVTRQLTSTLELEPLLNIILDSATNLLNCEAGSLLLVDPQTDELVFRVVTGPAKANLTGKRLPSGTGVVGKSVKTRQPIIVNDVQSSPDWFKFVDEQTGFVTRALLVIPLEVKDNIIGVIEVINKRGSSSFTQEDEDLLSAFASQAGIAIENARLYTMTDQALAARVEELSVMQRIDRELNASLEVNRTLSITLDWALRQSRTTAGLIGMVEGEMVRIAASNGYANELDALEGQLPLAHFSIQQAVDSGVPVRLNLEGALLTSSRALAVIPVRRENTTMAVILLESNQLDALDVNTLAFLTRLSDHASIAISNAQLYAAVQSANVAKSEFVSFVSHELKNPMTSIKGYTELLAAGAVGPVNEAQANFLTTIRTNTERMSTLVSDLNDVSRIEANRMRLDFKAQSLREVVDETVRSLRKQVEDKFQTLAVSLPDALPQVWADRTRLAQVVTNLISNAFKYTPQGGTITVAAEVCDNQWDPAGAKLVVHVWVKDTGIGISPEDQKKIFQKFFRSEDPKTREAPGTGLGLNITRSLVELQGGRIWFESEFRAGTTFHFTIPVVE